MDHAVVTTLNHFLVHHDGVEDPLSLPTSASPRSCSRALALVFLVAFGAARHPAPDGRRRGRQRGRRPADRRRLATSWTARGRSSPTRRRCTCSSPHAADGGFPSDHATAAFAIGVAVLLRHRAAGVVVLILAALLAVGRVAIGVHYPSDVLAGALLGTAVAVALWPPAVRALLDRLADLVGGVVDAYRPWASR